jgi:hypothetical protein
MTTMEIPGPPEHLTDATAGVGVGSGDGRGLGEVVGCDVGVGVGDPAWLVAGEMPAVGATAPQAIHMTANKTAE